MGEVVNLVSSTEEQANVLDDALRIFVERNTKYRDTWQQYGALANLVRSAQKLDRLMAVWWHESGEYEPLDAEALDDAYDAINHLAFFIRCAKEGNITGSEPQRPS